MSHRFLLVSRRRHREPGIGWPGRHREAVRPGGGCRGRSSFDRSRPIMNYHSQNLILNSLPKAELDLLLPRLQHARIRAHEVLVEPDEKIKDVYFPLSCMISLVT